MFSLLREFIRRIGRPLTVIVMDSDDLEPPTQFGMNPAHLLGAIGASVLACSVILVALITLTPVRGLLPGYASVDIHRDAVQNDMRLQAMADSLARQQEYVNRLRDMILGRVDTTMARRATVYEETPPPNDFGFSEPLATDNWADHEQPAVAFQALRTRRVADSPDPGSRPSMLSALSLPALPPVTGVLTRGYDARTGHFAIDLAVEEGSMVRSIGEGYVVLVDWTHDGGQVIAVQHADGFLSVYKHNSAVLKRVGDRVSDREAIARSGNSGEITTGPHLHFELWHNGLAQDPSYYLLGV
ncbi:MAG: M23 family metallopeptidase [Rhodothermales bacterium]